MKKKTKRKIHKCTCKSCAKHPYGKAAQQHQAINRVLLELNEKNRRRFVGVLANEQGRGGTSQLAEITGLAEQRLFEVVKRSNIRARNFRQEFVVREQDVFWSKKQPGILNALDKLLKDATAGDPVTGLKWTRKTCRKLANELKRKDFQVEHSTIPRLARLLGYTLRGNRKRLSRKQDDRRDQQMRYIEKQRKRFARKKQPGISVDGKKKRKLDNFGMRDARYAKSLWMFWQPTFSRTQSAKRLYTVSMIANRTKASWKLVCHTKPPSLLLSLFGAGYWKSEVFITRNVLACLFKLIQAEPMPVIVGCGKLSSRSWRMNFNLLLQ